MCHFVCVLESHQASKHINSFIILYHDTYFGICICTIYYLVTPNFRAQQKETEDIYNVNPQTWILETNENGTSGMSEIALETEMV